MARIASGILLIVALTAGLARGADPAEAVTIRTIHPDRQLERLIALFQGTRAPHPAAALAAWKRAAHDAKGLGKPLEAVIAALNPEMVRELRIFDEARIGLGVDPDDGHLRWYAVAPHDDGSLAALATALVLTDGGSDPPFQGVTIERLGPPGAPVVARVPGVATVAGSRGDLAAALRQAGVDEAVRPDIASGWLVRLDPSRLDPAGTVARRRGVEALRALGCNEIEATAGLEGDALSLVLTTSRRDAIAGGSIAIDPGWFDWVPASGVVAAAALALDPSPGAWDSAFAWADRVDRADPARAQVAPLRTRLNLLAAAAGVRPEVDLWPRLRGASGAVLADPQGAIDGGLIVLHAIDDASAAHLIDRVIPRLAASLTKGPRPAEPLEAIRHFGVVSGRPLAATRRGTAVLIGWGDSALSASLAAKDDPARSAGVAIRASWGKKPVRRAGMAWPGRLERRETLDAPPVVWWGWDEGPTTRDHVRWDGLHELVRRTLERLPLDPPPAQ